MKRRLDEASVAKIMEHLLERFGEPIGSAQGDRQGVPSKGGKKEDMGNRGFGAKLEHADGCGGEEMPTELPGITVGGHQSPRGAKPGGTAPGSGAKGKVAAGVHPPKDMDGIPETGSGRGTDNKKSGGGVAVVAVTTKAAPAPAPMVAAPAPKPMPTEMPPVHAEPRPMPVELDQCMGPGMNQDAQPNMPKPPASIAKDAKPKPMSTSMDEEDELDEKAPPGREKQVKALKKKKGVKNPFAVAWASYNKSHGDE